MKWRNCRKNKRALAPLPDAGKARRVTVTQRLEKPFVETLDASGVRRIYHHDHLLPMKAFKPWKVTE